MSKDKPLERIKKDANKLLEGMNQLAKMQEPPKYAQDMAKQMMGFEWNPKTKQFELPKGKS